MKEKGKGKKEKGRARATTRIVALLSFSFLLFTLSFGATGLAAETPTTIAAPSRAWHAVLANGFSIRHLRHEEVGPATRLWLSDTGYTDVPTAQISRFEREEMAPAPPGRDVACHVSCTPQVSAHEPSISPAAAIQAAAERHQVDPDFIASVVRAESGFNPHAISPKGAQGLMQLMPHTASQLGVQDRFDPAANADAGTRYLRALLLQYRGDAARALAAYNAGPQRVQQYGGVPPYAETRAYVHRIITDYNRRKIAADPTLAKASKQSSRRK